MLPIDVPPDEPMILVSRQEVERCYAELVESVRSIRPRPAGYDDLVRADRAYDTVQQRLGALAGVLGVEP